MSAPQYPTALAGKYLTPVEEHPDDPGPDAPYGDDEEDGPAAGGQAYAERLSLEVDRQRLREDARRQLRAERRDTAPPAPVLLTDLLAEPEPETTWRVRDLMPAGSRVMCAAAFKSGKSTLVGNLIHSLADGKLFLDRYDVTPCAGRIVLIDDELDRHMLRRWMRDHGIAATDQVVLVPLRGKVSSFDLLDSDTLTRWVDTLAALDPAMIVLDCLRPVLDALGLDEKSEAGRFLVAFDELVDRSGVSEAIVVHHMGHTGERSRGDSRLRDWPDVEWRLVREDPENPASPRYFTAFGRDVDQSEQQLAYNTITRELCIAGGTRAEARDRAAIPAVLDLLVAEPGLSGRAIEDKLMGGDENLKQKAVRGAVKLAVRDGDVRREDGPNRSKVHYRTEKAGASVRRGASPVRQRAESGCVGASIDDALTRTDSREVGASGDALPETDLHLVDRGSYVEFDPLGRATCERCEQPADRLLLGRCPGCAYPTEDPPDYDDGQDDDS